MSNSQSDSESTSSKLRRLMAIFGRFSDKAATLEFSGPITDHYFDIIRRAAMVRQREALDAIVALSEAGRPEFGVCFLRPAYEELVWIEYLSKHKAIASDLIIQFLRLGIQESLNAQSRYVGPTIMKTLGFTQEFLAHADEDTEVREKLQAYAAQLGWRQGSTAPSFSFICKEVGRKDEYKYLYMATSRFVHFSPTELIRRAWGNSKSVTISSKHFSPYWEKFAVHWAFRIFTRLYIVCDDLLDHQAHVPGDQSELEQLIADCAPPTPIITREELYWSD